MREVVREAFLVMCDKNSPDVVIADPDLNQRFLQACQERGLAGNPLALNLCLLNLRKAGGLQGIKSKRTVVRNQDDYRFASEIAVRFLERRDQISLDQILCDPNRAAQFDAVAGRLAPGFSSFQYRWAALNLRKKNRLRPELLGKVVLSEDVITCKVAEIDVDQIPGERR